MISDKELENNARKDIIDNMKNFFEVYNDQKEKIGLLFILIL